MELDGKSLESWLENQFENTHESIPNLYRKYKELKSSLLRTYKDITVATTLTELRAVSEEGFDFDKIILLNDHGLEHINTVIERASLLIEKSKINLNAKEVYYLLVAILLHDLGNFDGRKGHEKRSLRILTKERAFVISEDSFEKTYILQVAASHGGKTENGDKDTISKIKEKITVLDIDVKLRLIASILRFADELADDKKRANIDLLINNKLPKGSEVFHAFSSCLDTVRFRSNEATIELHFKIPKSFMERKFGKYNEDKKIVEEVYLLDEIYLRVMKMNIERRYCSMFWKKWIDIETIWIELEFYNEDVDGWFETVHDDITFQLSDVGYPNSEIDLFVMCPNLKYNDGKFITGVNASNKIKDLYGTE
jgi:hypothetical protein